MSIPQINQNIRKELKNNIDKEYKKRIIRFFKENEKVKFYGVRKPIVKKIADSYFKKFIKGKDKKEVFSLCEKLLNSDYDEEKHIAFDWTFKLKDQYKKRDFIIFEKWLKKYITNWASCDDFCMHAFGYFLYLFPETSLKIKKWSNSENRWLKRASAVIFIYSIRRGKYLEEIFNIADKLLQDKDDLVKKGYGWALKEASNVYQEEVFDFIIKRKNKIPRTALRYAIEKMPEEKRKKAMSL